MLFVCHHKILRKHCTLFLLGVKTATRETENNVYAKFCGNKQRALWYIMVFFNLALKSNDLFLDILEIISLSNFG